MVGLWMKNKKKVLESIKKKLDEGWFERRTLQVARNERAYELNVESKERAVKKQVHVIKKMTRPSLKIPPGLRP